MSTEDFVALQARLEAAEAELQAIRTSISWRLAQRMRHLTLRVPGLRRTARLSVATFRWLKRIGPSGPAPLLRPPQASRRPSRPGPLAALWYEAAQPEVSIIVLNYRGAEYTRDCVESIWRHTAGVRYELIIADNGSGEAELAQLRRLRGPCRLLPIATNRQFGEGNNIAAEAARGSFVLFLNNDTVVTEGWLAPLVEALRHEPGLGAVGPRLLRTDGRVQCTGCLLLPDGRIREIGSGAAPDDQRFTASRSVDYVAGAALLMRRVEFLAAGGFDPLYEPAYYEDVDLCLRLRAAGLDVRCLPQASVLHYGSVSQSKALSVDDVSARNRVKLVARWRRRGPLPLPPLPLRQAPPEGRPRVLLHSPIPLQAGGGERYLLTLAEALSTHYQVALLPDQPHSRLRLERVATTFGLDLSRVALLTGEAEAVAFGPDLFISMGNTLMPARPSLAPRGVYLCQFPFPEDPLRLSAHMPHLASYQCVVVYSDFVARHFRADAAAVVALPPPVRVISPACPQPPRAPRGRPVGAPLHILAVGRFFTGDHCKRQDTLLRAFARLQRLSPRPLHLHLAGATHPEPKNQAFLLQCRALARGLPVSFHTDISGEEMQAHLAEADICWHGAGLGVDAHAEPSALEHFGIAVLEGMAQGALCFAMAAGGPAEIIRPGETGYLFHDEDELVSLSLAAIEAWDSTQIMGIRQAASTAVEAHLPAVMAARWQALAAEMLGDVQPPAMAVPA